MTLEAFADTVVSRQKRWDGDSTVAGVAPGGGAVAAGAVPLREMPEGGLAPALDTLAAVLDEQARALAVEYGAPGPDGSTGGPRGVLSLTTTLQHG